MSAYFWLTLTKSTVYSLYTCIWMTLIPMRERYGILFLYSTLCVRDHQLVRKSLSYFVYEDIWFDSIGKHFFFYHFLTKILRIISFIEIFSSAGICWKEKEKKSGCVLHCWTIPTNSSMAQMHVVLNGFGMERSETPWRLNVRYYHLPKSQVAV